MRRGAAGIGRRKHQERAPAMRLAAVGIDGVEHRMLQPRRRLGEPESAHRGGEPLLHRRQVRHREGLEGGILHQRAGRQRSGAHQTGTRPLRWPMFFRKIRRWTSGSARTRRLCM